MASSTRSSSPTSESSFSSVSSLLNAIFPKPRPAEERVKAEQLQYEAQIVCEDFVQRLAICSSKHFISVVWNCREENEAMHKCMREYMSQGIIPESKKLQTNK
jgi:hypothetical protein